MGTRRSEVEGKEYTGHLPPPPAFFKIIKNKNEILYEILIIKPKNVCLKL
jgi:hypothetical protein